MSNIEQLVLQAKTCFQTKDYETCMSLTDEALRADPGNTEASWLMKEAQRQWEDQRSLEQLEIYVENLKKEAMDLFDQEHYEQCLGMFRFLSELEPENHTLRDYVRLSQQMFVETIGPGEPTANQPGASSSDSDQKQSETLDLGFNRPDTDLPSPLIAAVMPDSEGKTSVSDAPTLIPETGTPKALILESEAIPESVKRKVIQDYIASAVLARRKRSWNVALTTALFLVTTLVAGCFWLYSSFGESRIEIQSTPEKAVVFIDNKRVGETPFRQQGIRAGSYALRIEKQGYRPDSRNLAVERTQTIMLVVQLEKAKAVPSSTIQSTAPLAPQTQTPASQPSVSDPVEEDTTAVQIAQSVIHQHLLGSCTGRLKIDGDKISFWSSGNSQDAFTRKIRQITNFELSEKLLIEFKDKSYRFEALARDPKDNRQRLAPFYEQIKLHKSPPRKPR
jgi:tetratricopeptide (TPR) repeat protein